MYVLSRAVVRSIADPCLSAALSALAAPVRWEDIQPYTTPDQLSEGLLTLSLMPRSRWQTLLNLETIKVRSLLPRFLQMLISLRSQQRNKPKEAPKAPERAPFFLPTLPGTNQRFDFGTEEAKAVEEKKNRKLDIGAASVETDFVRRLLKEDPEGECELCLRSCPRILADCSSADQSFFEYLKALSPSATDLELRSLSTLPHLQAFLHAISARLRSHRDFEAVQTFLACFLRIHGDVLVQNVELKEEMVKVAAEQKRESSRLMDLTHYALGTLAFLRSTPIA